MNQYTELYAWIRHSFGDESFSIDSFRAVFPTSQAPKVIHDLVSEGYLQRTDRGVYRAVKPEKLIEGIIQKDASSKDIVMQHTKATSSATALFAAIAVPQMVVGTIISLTLAT